ncbi:MAG TPA: hypothetical protein VJO99_27735 [Burkholderiaceae bacterium]|nr:hypothetical protein [Burkholderiaceae bacterium]
MIVAALAYAAFWTAWSSLEIMFPWGNQLTIASIVARALLSLMTTMETVLSFAVATVAVARGASGWLAYPLALAAAATLGTATSMALAPYPFPYLTRTAGVSRFVLMNLAFVLPGLLPVAQLYVFASNARHRARLLHAAESERAAEAERLAQQRLQAELASIDHALVLAALRHALGWRPSRPERADALLALVAEYLRAAQQRGGSDPQRIAKSLAELRRACTAAADVIADGYAP